jgi:hypothetical protein
MSRVVVHCIVILSLFGTCAAQKHPCRFGSTSDVGHVKGVTVQQFPVIEKSRKVGATVFIPDGNEPLPSIVFSALSENLDKRAFYAAFWKATNSVFVTAKRCAFSSR